MSATKRRACSVRKSGASASTCSVPSGEAFSTSDAISCAVSTSESSADSR
jgi:hypothetical protein